MRDRIVDNPGTTPPSSLSQPTLGEVLHRARTARRLTLDRLASLCGCTKGYLSGIENGRRENPAEELLRRLERALGLDGELLAAARWHATPKEVRERFTQLNREADETKRRLAELLRGKGLDELYRSGELRNAVAAVDPEAGPNGSAADGGEQRVPSPGVRVPLINSVAAGMPREFTDLGYPAGAADKFVRTPDLNDPDAFAARVVGDSMAPEYREGDIVVFSPARDVRSGMDCFARLEPDRNSYSETTFKRVYFETDDRGREVIRLQPLNPAYPAKVLRREKVAALYAAVSVTRKIG